MTVGALAAECGWSRRHLAERFRADLGLSPKTLARVLRFRRALRALERGDGTGLAAIAVDRGHYDQAHLNRDFRAFRRRAAGGVPGPAPASPILPRHRRPGRVAWLAMSNVYPALRAHDARGLIEFLERAFGFERHFVVDGENGTIAHAEIRCNGDGMVMIGSERADDPYGSNAGHSWIYVVIDDTDAHYERATAAGAQILREPFDQDYGSRDYATRDPEGNIWSFGTYDPNASG